MSRRILPYVFVVVTFCAMVAAVWWDSRAEAQGRWNHCDAPCIVNFPEGTPEDEYREDFTHDGLHVWKAHNGD